MNSTIFYANGTSKTIVPENSSQFTYDEIRKIIGGWLATLSYQDGTIIFDEEGKLKGLPKNELATKTFGNRLWDDDYFVGTVLFIKNSEMFD